MNLLRIVIMKKCNATVYKTCLWHKIPKLEEFDNLIFNFDYLHKISFSTL